MGLTVFTYLVKACMQLSFRRFAITLKWHSQHYIFCLTYKNLTRKPIIPTALDTLQLPTVTGTEQIIINNILRIEAISNYSKIYFSSLAGEAGRGLVKHW